MGETQRGNLHCGRTRKHAQSRNANEASLTSVLSHTHLSAQGCTCAVDDTAFVTMIQLLSVLVPVAGECGMYRRSGLFVSREQGMRYHAGFAVPT